MILELPSLCTLYSPVGSTKSYTVMYLRVSTETNVENHQNDAAISQFQDDVSNSYRQVILCCITLFFRCIML